ncbi:MAG: MarR family transcriptional regulator [Burkholderiales bacterium]
MKIEPTADDQAESVPSKPATFYRADTYRPEESVGWMMQRIVSEVGQEIERRLSDDGPTSPQWMPLFKLHLGEASTVAELARSCRLDAGAMTRLLDRLEAKGLCRRCRSTTDRRVVNVELTDEGRRCAQEIPAVLCLVQNEHLTGFSEAEWQQLKGFLRRIMNNAKAIQSRESNDENA